MKNGSDNKSTPSNSNPADSPSMTTVIIASPVVENCKLAIAVKNSQYQPIAEFESIFEISQDLHIFKGTLPNTVEYGSKFKFVYVNSEDKKNKIEHKSVEIIRKQKSINDSWMFFFFKLPQRYFFENKLKKGISELNETKIKKQIASKFFVILFKHICDEVLSEKEWDGVFESWYEGLKEIQDIVGPRDTSDGFRDFLDMWIFNWTPKAKINFDQLFLLVVGAYFMKVNFEKMGKIFVSNSEEFSLYLHKSIQCQLRQKNQDRLAILNNIVKHGGGKFLWIFFHINEQHSRFDNHANHEEFQSILETLKDIPEVLLDNQECVSRVINYLVLSSNDIDELNDKLRPTFDKDVKYQQLLNPYLLEYFLLHRTAVEDLIKIICSKFMKNTYEMAVRQETSLDKSIKTIFNNKKLMLDLIKLALHTPDYLLPVVTPVVETNVSQKLEKIPTFTSEEYDFLSSQLEKDSLSRFPQIKKQIEVKLLKMAKDFVQLGYFQNVKSVKLILLALAEMRIPFLESPKFVDLQKAMAELPLKFYQNLYAALNPLEKTLEPYQKGETSTIVEKLENHFDYLDELVKRIEKRDVVLNEFPWLKDPRVQDLMKTSFVSLGRKLADISQEVEELRERHKLYGFLYSKFSNSTRPANIQQDDEGASIINSESIQILDSEEWENYLKGSDSENSILTLKDVMEMQLPLQLISAKWLFEIRESALFMKKVWLPMTKSLKYYPLCNEDLQFFVVESAAKWKELARTVADGTASFKEMDEIISLQPNPDFLSRKHPQSQPIVEVLTAYQNFKNLQKLRHLIGPFVAALQLFSIEETKLIDKLYDFVEKNLIKNWETTTLSEITENGILKVINEDLKIDSERPETRNAMEFVSSLVTTDDNRSPVIEWLRKKTETDMDAMGKLLQGNLLEAYGQVQTLRTRIAPFLQAKFNTAIDLLQAVRESEERFAQRHSGRIQPIDCKWLANLLPEIEAAVRASIISPSEDAKEKLGKLRQVVIEPKNESYAIEVRLEPNGSLSMEELKQAFQLLDMAVDVTTIEVGNDADDVNRTRRNVGQIEQLSEVFELLFASGCISYTFREKIMIELADLDTVLGRWREQLKEWNNQWEEMEQLPLLALFSRGYLLQLADLIARNKIEDVVSILQILLPSAASKIEKFVIKLVQQQAPRIDVGEAWLSTAQLFKILRDLHQLIKDVSQQGTADLLNRDDPPHLKFLVAYGQTLKSYVADDAK